MSENLPAVRDDNVFSLMDALDDDLIKAELENRVVNTWVYSFKNQGKMCEGLSKAGVDAACAEFAKQGHVIEESEVNFQQDPTDPDFILFTCTASRYLVNVESGERVKFETVNGTKRQCIKMKAKGKMIADPFWFEKGAMKAVRNARARLIPEEVKASIIALAKQGGKVKEIDTPTEKPAPPVDMGSGSTFEWAKGADKRFIEAWIKDNVKPEDDSDPRELFKRWADGFNMIGRDDNGRLTLNKVNMALYEKIKKNPGGARDSFNLYYKTELAKEVFGGEQVA